MATSTPNASIEMSMTVTLTEAEVRALNAIMGYGVASFLKAISSQLSEALPRAHEAGIRSLFDTLQPQCVNAIKRAEAARLAFNVDAYEVRKREPVPPSPARTP